MRARQTFSGGVRELPFHHEAASAWLGFTHWSILFSKEESIEVVAPEGAVLAHPFEERVQALRERAVMPGRIRVCSGAARFNSEYAVWWSSE